VDVHREHLGLAALALFSTEALFSSFWLARFRFGPLEWLWRTASYARPQPVRRAAALPSRAEPSGRA
jgi:uncharacterized membrane protein YeiB